MKIEKARPASATTLQYQSGVAVPVSHHSAPRASATGTPIRSF